MSVTQKEIVEAFEYRDGLIYNIGNRGSRAKAGNRAGALYPCGYRYIKINGKTIKEHRLIYTMFHGEIPAGYQIDHIDGNSLNNKIENLRLATNSQNQMNSGIDSMNKTGFKGVSKRKDSNRYQAEIKVGGKGIYLGLYKTPEEAHMAYVNASKEHHMDYGRTA